MVIKQAFYRDTDDCIHFDAQEDGCGKGSITIQEGRCCDYERPPAAAATQMLKNIKHAGISEEV